VGEKAVRCLEYAVYVLVRFLLGLRYRIRIHGLHAVRRRGTRGILFLPNHPALIDPVMITTLLYPAFRVRPLADEQQVSRPVLRWITRRIRTVTIPDMARVGLQGRQSIHDAFHTLIEALRRGENVVLYPAGRTYRSRREDLRGARAVETLARACPDMRIVLVRTTGLWGSSFSRAAGRAPDLRRILLRGLLRLLANGVLFGPRRTVDIECCEPGDLPRDQPRQVINRYLESFYNTRTCPATYVPYTWWERGGARCLPEPRLPHGRHSAPAAPAATLRRVVAYLSAQTGLSDVHPSQNLSADLGFDSLQLADLLAWLETEFAARIEDAESLQTVADVVLAAAAGGAVRGPLAVPGAAWFAKPAAADRVALPCGETLTDIFLRQARQDPDRVIVADQTSGLQTYRRLITGIYLLKPWMRRQPGARVGIMLPASVAAATLYWACLFAGKTPVLLNWTSGTRALEHALQLSGVKIVFTARALIERLSRQGMDLAGFDHLWCCLEDIRQHLNWGRKITAALRSRGRWAALSRTPAPRIAALLFTSGSEAAPKAVPLTQANIIANLRDIAATLRVFPGDRLIGILPPFHSFGLSATVLLPLCGGIPVVYHPNPTESAAISRIIEAYGVTVFAGTPTFLRGIVQATPPSRLSSLRLAFVGAESCPEALYHAAAARAPQLRLLEGYGITECSPVVSLNDDHDPVPGSIGRVLPSLEYAVVDEETGAAVAPGRRGLLLVRGPSVFEGYLGHAGQQPFVEHAGQQWYATGDLVVEDQRGVLRFAGRRRRFVKIGGEMISLQAVEAALQGHVPQREDGAPVIAVDAAGGDDHPALVLFAAVPLDREQVNAWLRQEGLSALHAIRRVVRVEAIPLLGTGKTDYRALRSRLS
jgi:long-chain-fatty-acid--[acyl-carrier-protein] ligase